jgi:hypothetical protein
METAKNIAILSDIHGQIPNLERAIAELSNEIGNIDAIIMNGDYSPHNIKTVEDLIKLNYYTLAKVAEIGIPTLCIPGSHEPPVFNQLSQLVESKYDNFSTLLNTNTRYIYKLEDIELELHPGSGVQQAVDDNPQLSGSFPTDYTFGDIIPGSKRVLFTHDPPKCEAEHGIDRSNFTFIEELENPLVPIPSNCGHKSIRSKIFDEDIRVSINGHIHEAGGRAVDLRNGETLLEQNYKHDRLNLNVGAILNGMYSVVEVFSEPEEITGAKFEARKVA